MAGIYIHIPFCKKACHYCDFHFSTNLDLQAEMVDAICSEIEKRKKYIPKKVQTIYYGGGTPSLLTSTQLDQIQSTIFRNFEVDKNAEISLEANPDDLDTEKLITFKQLNINRLSIGFQTMSEQTLQWMNRSHSLQQGIEAYENAREVGFENISIDLMYALPYLSESSWKSGILEVINLKPEHLSIYGLTIEEKTVFGNWEKNQKLIQIPEEKAAKQYLQLIELLEKNGYKQYEVSNFSLPNFRSKHNGSYWKGVHYLGVGPGAHSFNGISRQFNIRNNPKYIQKIKANEIHFELEHLSEIQKQNEEILTSLRTIEGLNLKYFKEKYKVDLLEKYNFFLKEMKTQEILKIQDNHISLLPKGFLIADEIALKMFE